MHVTRKGGVLTSSSDQRQCVLAECLSYASTSGGSSRSRYLAVGSFRPAKNVRIRTGTDQGNPTV
jgi:hypothetical protein